MGIRYRLTAVGIRNAPNGRLHDGGGLYLIKTGPDTGRWVYRYQIKGRRRDMGLGSFGAVSLADARAQRNEMELTIAGGADPIEQKRQSQKSAALSFQELATAVYEAKRGGLRDRRGTSEWLAPLRNHVYPVFGHLSATSIGAADIQQAMAPIWRTKHDTARKTIQRIQVVLRGGKRMGLPCDLEACDSAVFMLGIHHHQPQPIPATPWQDIPSLYAKLSEAGPAGDCLRFMILTAVRLSGCRLAVRSEVAGDVWTVPADRVKGRRGLVSDFHVPLSGSAQSLLVEAGESWLFPSVRGDGPVSGTTLRRVLDGIGEAGRPHGFRSSFRTWVQETDAASYDVAETALSHKVGRAVERSYARSDLIAQRRVLAEKWSAFVTGEQSKVVGMNGKPMQAV